MTRFRRVFNRIFRVVELDIAGSRASPGICNSGVLLWVGQQKNHDFRVGQYVRWHGVKFRVHSVGECVDLRPLGYRGPRKSVLLREGKIK